MSRYESYYFKSRPGVIWVLNRLTGVWTRHTDFIKRRVYEPSCHLIKRLNNEGWHRNFVE